MKTVIWSFLLCVLFTASATAQPGPPGGDRGWPPSPEERVGRLSKDLNLDEEQSTRLVEIFTATDAQREVLRKKHGEQIRQDVCALHKSTSEQIKRILTEQQSAEFDKLKARMKDHRDRHYQQRGKDRWSDMNCEESDS